MRTLRSSLCILLLGAVVVFAVGCAHEIPAQHYAVTLDDNGTRTEGAIDFPSYTENDPQCADNDASVREQVRDGGCTYGMLARGVVSGNASLASAEIDLDAEDNTVYSIVVLGEGSSDNYVCTLTGRDITHAVQCERVGSATGICSITLVPK